MPTIISLHVPKSGGVSFRNWLESALGEGRIIWDYGDGVLDPAAEMNTAPAAFLAKQAAGTTLQAGYLAVHGHFWIEKYRSVQDALRICFLRDPLQRTISHYFYWKTADPQEHQLHQRFLEEDWDILQFAQVPEMKHFYRDFYFRNSAIGAFDFVGDMARYESEIARLEKLTNLTGSLPIQNRNTFDRYEQKVEEIFADAALMATLRDLLAPEIDFYHQHAGK